MNFGQNDQYKMGVISFDCPFIGSRGSLDNNKPFRRHDAGETIQCWYSNGDSIVSEKTLKDVKSMQFNVC